MRGCSLLLASLSLGCFADPPSAGGSGDGSTEMGDSGSAASTATSTATSPGSTSASTAEPGDSTGDTSSSGVDGSTTSVEASCGDGNTDPGEDCDDANEIDGDGCNVDCRESGSVMWVETLPTVLGTRSDTLNAVLVLPSGQILAGGSRFIGDPGAFYSEANLVRFSPEGALEMEDDIVTSERIDSVRGLTSDATGRIYVVGERDNVPNMQSSGWVAEIDVDGAPIGGIVDSSVGERSGFRAVAAGPGLVTAVGFQGDGETGVSTHAVSYSPALEPTGTDDSVGSDPAQTQSYLFDVAMDEHGVYVAGYRTDGGTTVRGFTTTSPVGGVAYVPPNDIHNSYVAGVAIAQPGNINSVLWSAGWNDAADFPHIAQLYQVSRAGVIEDALPGYTGASSQGAFYRAIVIDPAGNIVLAGGSFVDDGTTDFVPLVRKLRPDGEERWTRVFNTPGGMFGGISALDVDEDGTIAACGHSSDAGGERRQLVAKLRP